MHPADQSGERLWLSPLQRAGTSNQATAGNQSHLARSSCGVRRSKVRRALLNPQAFLKTSGIFLQTAAFQKAVAFLRSRIGDWFQTGPTLLHAAPLLGAGSTSVLRVCGDQARLSRWPCFVARVENKEPAGKNACRASSGLALTRKGHSQVLSANGG